MNVTAVPAISTIQELGEGPMWDGRRLHWVDITSGRVFRWSPAVGEIESCELGGFVSAVLPGGNRLVITRQHTVEYLDWESGNTEILASIPDKDPTKRINDAKCDSRGRLWFGELSLRAEQHSQRLFCLEPDGTLHTVRTGVSLSNGIGWSPDDNNLYFIDSDTRTLEAISFDSVSGTLGTSVVTREFVNGVPDGLAVDSEGGVWVALWDGGRVERIDPASGDVVRTVTCPVSRPTSCCFVDRRLYITSARTDEPSSGGLFVAETGFSAPPAAAFGAVAR